MFDQPCRRVVLESPDYERTLELRARVLLAPFRIPLSAATVDDRNAIHFGLFADSTVDSPCLACLLLVPRAPGELQLRQMATAPEFQRRGLGSRLHELAETWARAGNARRLFAHAREPALPFYSSLGYVVLGPPFMEVGLTHRRIEKALPPP